MFIRFYCSVESGKKDFVGAFFAVSAGFGVEELVGEYEERMMIIMPSW
ncbi:MAG: hypothetical protein IPI30_14110 [Saprospiraceae bacterium]|nr:hypothetical protein [Candidatus Vicinibacter affinis]